MWQLQIFDPLSPKLRCETEHYLTLLLNITFTPESNFNVQHKKFNIDHVIQLSSGIDS